MPYENIPTENAPALSADPNAYGFTVTLDGFLSNGMPRATIDDLDMFDAETKTSNKQMLDFLDRVVTRVTLRGEQLFSHVPAGEDGSEIGLRAEGVRGKNIAYPALKRIFEAVGAAMKEQNDAKN